MLIDLLIRRSAGLLYLASDAKAEAKYWIRTYINFIWFTTL
jgi:hypothetical protein